MGWNVSSVSASSTQATVGASVWQQNRQVLDQLAQALQSANLPNAQQAFSTLTANNTNALSTNSQVTQLGAALSSGDLNSASQQFYALQPIYAQRG